ncbi:MAG: ABC transporter substrate-binding protein, partial [Alphaproteobacteria bacterium]|nr:ABC transporter substrate-binding protein [Alphaproteobacteria bacterium]
MKKRLLVFFFAIMLLTCFAAQAEITLAVIAPKAGDYAHAGKELFEGARLAAQEINDKGGINGEKIDLLTIDDRCDDRLALSTAEMLTLLKSKKIGLVVGPYCSNRFAEITDIYERAKIFQIVPTTEAYHSSGTNKKGQIVLLGSKAQMSADFFKFYNNNFAGLKVGFVYNGKASTGYTDVAKTLYDEFKHFGKGDLLKFYMLNADVKDIDDVVQ